MRRTVICRPRMRFISMFNAQRSNVQRSTFNVQRPTLPRSTFNVQPSTFNVQRSTFNLTTFNDQRSHVQPSTFNVQHSTTNVQRSHVPAFQRSTFTRSTSQPSPFSYRLSAIVYRLSSIGYRLSAIVYRLSFIGYQLSAIGYDQPSTAINTHPPAHVGAPDPHSSETQDRAAAPGSGRSGHRAEAQQGRTPRSQPVQPAG